VPNQSVTRAGYIFNGWFLQPADTYSWNFASDLMPARDITLVAHWTLIPVYHVYYNANGGAGPVPVDALDYYPGNSATVLATPQPTRTGYSFLGWATTPGGSVAYAGGDSLTMPAADVWLYAQWQPDVPPVTYTVTYFANGGSGSQSDANSPYAPNSEVTVLGVGSISRVGYTFLGWAMSSNGAVAYQPGATFVITGNVNLYAQWQANEGVPDEPEPRDPFDRQTGNVLFDLFNGRVPLGGIDFAGAWSVLNLILSLIALLDAFALLFTIIKRKRDDRSYETDANGKRVLATQLNAEGEEVVEEAPLRRLRRLKIPALLVGIIPIILFFLLEDITLPIVWIDRWTPLIAVVFLIHIILVIVQFAVKRRIDDDEDY
jgi:uncharacterized repeat protein (TIGR02543 family)